MKSDTPVICMDISPTKGGECVPTSSGKKPSLVVPTFAALVLRTAMMSEMLNERSFEWVSD